MFFMSTLVPSPLAEGTASWLVSVLPPPPLSSEEPQPAPSSAAAARRTGRVRERVMSRRMTPQAHQDRRMVRQPPVVEHRSRPLDREAAREDVVDEVPARVH